MSKKAGKTFLVVKEIRNWLFLVDWFRVIVWLAIGCMCFWGGWVFAYWYRHPELTQMQVFIKMLEGL